MRSLHFDRAARVLAALALALAVATTASSARGQRRRVVVTEASYTAPAIRVPYVDRPLTTTRLHLSLYFGLGFEFADYYKSYAPPARSVWGLGAHFDASFGATDWLEVALGVGARVTDDARNLGLINPERLARINREWLPTSLELARQPNAPYVLGHEYVTNPYARVRFAFLNRVPVFVGLDLYLTAPIAPRSCFATDIGVPLHFAIAHRVRIETGVFHEFVWCEVAPPQGLATRYWSMQIPLRVLFQIVPRFWLGLRTGFETLGYRFDTMQNIAIPLGIEAGVRLIPRLDLFFHVVAPEFIHEDPVLRRNVWLDRIGTGVAIQAWLL
jgi:hypothetical protein